MINLTLHHNLPRSTNFVLVAYVLLAVLVCAAPCATSAKLNSDDVQPSVPSAADGEGYFPMWLDPPGSSRYQKEKPEWYDTIVTAKNTTFTTNTGATVSVNNGEHGAIHLFADPSFLNGFDDKIRKWNGDLASTKTGTFDRCGWPNSSAADTPAHLQYSRRTTPMIDDFSNGLDPSNFNAALVKGCCTSSPQGKYGGNLGITTDVVNGVEKNVLMLTAINEDDPENCPGPNCHKVVRSSGSVSSADLFASGRYEVIAKVANASGLIWAVWTFHFEEHLPANCADYSCWCSRMPADKRVAAKCNNIEKGCLWPNLCDGNTDGWSPKIPPAPPVLSPEQCGIAHTKVGSDPQFLGDDSFAAWLTQVNHEIDIEIPANCANTPNVCNNPSWIPGARTCVGSYDTLNMNNYIYTQGSGTGPAYLNMCARVKHEDGRPFLMIGDDQYHNYTISWHTGDGTGNGYTEFYVDGVYMGTNNAFAPTRGSRLYIAHWGEQSKNRLWNGWPDDWMGGTPGDGESYSVKTLISEVRITPYNEPGDLMSPSSTDMPTGCTPNYYTKYPDICHPHWDPYPIPPAITPGESP